MDINTIKKEWEEIRWMMDEANPEEFSVQEVKDKARDLMKKIIQWQVKEDFKNLMDDEKPDLNCPEYQKYLEDSTMRIFDDVIGELAESLQAEADYIKYHGYS